MAYLGDYNPGDVIYFNFTSLDISVSPAVPYDPASLTVSIYKNDSNAQSTAGVTLTTPFDTVTGLINVKVDTSADGTFYASGNFFQAIITVGTVHAVSVVGYVLDSFTLQKTNALRPTTAGRTLDVSSGGEAGLDWANIGSPTTTVGLTGTTISSSQVVASVSGAVGSVTGNVGGNVTGSVGSVAGNVSGNVTGSVGSVLNMTIRSGTAQGGTPAFITLDAGASATNNLYVGELITITSGTGAGQTRTIVSYNGNTKNANVDRNWITTPTSSSVFAILATDNPSLNTNLQVTANNSQAVIRSGTAQAGSTIDTIVLDSGALATNSIYVGDIITLTGGTGVGQTRTIVAYNGTSKVATVDRNWIVTPDATTTFNILASATPTLFSDQGVAQAGSSSSITLASTASSVTGVYVGSIVTILSGTDEGDTSVITAYNGSTKVATVSPNFAVSPDTTSSYAVIPTQSGSGAQPGTQDVNVISYASFPVSVDANGLPNINAQNIGGAGSVGTPGYVGVDWGQVANKTTTNALTGTTISTSQVVASVTGAVGSVTGAVGSVTGNVGGNVTGSVGSVVGAVGSVTGNVGGNVTGSVGSLATQAKADVAAGWDAAALVACTGLPTTHGQALTYQIQQRNNKEHADKNTGIITLYENDGTTVKSTQTYADTATTADRSAMA